MIAALVLSSLVARDEGAGVAAPAAVPRVALVSDATSVLSQHLAAELRGVGLVVVERGASDEDVFAVGSGSGSTVVVVVVGAAVDVVAVRSGVAWHGVVDEADPDVDEDLFTLQVSERVRGLLLAESLRPREVRTVVEVTPAPPPERLVMLRAAVDTRVAVYAGGVPAALGVDVAVAARPLLLSEHLEFGVLVTAPLTSSGVATPDGAIDTVDANVVLGAVQATLAAPFRLHERVEVAIGAGAGPLWLHVDAKASGDLVGLQQDLLLTAAHVDALLRFRVVSSLWVEGGVRVVAVTPRPVFVVNDVRLAALDSFGGAFFVGVSGTFPDGLADPEIP